MRHSIFRTTGANGWGRTRSEVVERCPLFLLVKMSSEAPTIINHENQDLHHRVVTFYRGFVLSKKFNAEKRPFLAIGGRSSGDIQVRSFGELERPAGALIADDEPVDEECLKLADRVAEGLRPFTGAWQEDRWRLIRCIDIYEKARCNLDFLTEFINSPAVLKAWSLPSKTVRLMLPGSRTTRARKPNSSVVPSFLSAPKIMISWARSTTYGVTSNIYTRTVT